MKCLRVCTFAQTCSAASLSSTPLSTPKPEVATWKPPAQGQQPGVLSPATRSPGGAASSIAASGHRHRQCVQEEAQEKTSVASRRGTCGNCQWNRTRASGRKQAETTQLPAKILWITQSPRYENFGEAKFPSYHQTPASYHQAQVLGTGRRSTHLSFPQVSFTNSGLTSGLHKPVSY